MKYFLVILFLTSISSFAQSVDTEDILNKVDERFSVIEDYEVEIFIEVDVEGMNIPDSKAVIRFKKPDKMDIESEEFALIPKEGINFAPKSVFGDDFTSIYVKDDVIDDSHVYVIKIIPLSDGSDIILSTVWIDKTSYVIRKVESTTKLNGTFEVALRYDTETVKQYPLPEQMTFSFDLKTVRMPTGYANQIGGGDDDEMVEKPAKGSVYITYTNYKINSGIPDSVFEKKEADDDDWQY